MPMNRPQNPIYPVDETAYEVLLPKVVCAHCGSVHVLRGRIRARLRCCACGGLNEITLVGSEWHARAIESPADGETPPPPSPPRDPSTDP